MTIRMWVQSKGSPNQSTTAGLQKPHLTPTPSSLFPLLSSEPDDEMSALASSSEKCGSRSSHRLPVKDWKASPRGSPKLWRKSKRDNGYVGGCAGWGDPVQMRFAVFRRDSFHGQVASLWRMMVALTALGRTFTDGLTQERFATFNFHFVWL